MLRISLAKNVDLNSFGFLVRVASILAAVSRFVSSDAQNAPGYIGCFKDSFSDGRALRNDFVSFFDQSVEWCFRYCLDVDQGSSRYLGLKNGNFCTCVDNEDYDRQGTRPDSECHYSCVGNKNETCGSSNRISIYEISQGVCSNDIGPPTYGSHRITNPHSLDYNLNNFKFFGTRVDFYCHDGYTLNGASSIQCIDTGYNNVTWNDTVPTCEGLTSATDVMMSSPGSAETTNIWTSTIITTAAATTETSSSDYPPTITKVQWPTTNVTSRLQTDHVTTDESSTSPADSRRTTMGNKTNLLGVIAGSLGALFVIVILAVGIVMYIAYTRRRRQRHHRRLREDYDGTIDEDREYGVHCSLPDVLPEQDANWIQALPTCRRLADVSL